jgi:hypothetical protein
MDAKNYPVLGNFAEKAYANKLAERTFSDLKALTNYVVYVTCGNDYPAIPELLEGTENVDRLITTTSESPAPTPLNLDTAILLTLASAFLLLF